MASEAVQGTREDEKYRLQHPTPSDAVDMEKAVHQTTAIEPKSEVPVSQEQLVYSVFSPGKKILILVTAAVAMMLSPLTASMYYPVIPVLADDLGVSINDINLTITAYLVRKATN